MSPAPPWNYPNLEGPTPDSVYIESIAKMDTAQLLAEVLGAPEYLTDPYYRDFGAAIQKRGAELLSTYTV